MNGIGDGDGQFGFARSPPPTRAHPRRTTAPHHAPAAADSTNMSAFAVASSAARAAPPRRAAAAAAAKPRGASAVVKPLGGARRSAVATRAKDDFQPETDLELSDLTAISPIDGRYGAKVKVLRACFSEYALVRARVIVEVRWLQKLASIPQIAEVPPLSDEANQFLEDFLANFSPADAAEVKKVERTTNHDVKAVEYVIKDRIASNPELHAVTEFVHFACTSEDIQQPLPRAHAALRDRRDDAADGRHHLEDRGDGGDGGGDADDEPDARAARVADDARGRSSPTSRTGAF